MKIPVEVIILMALLLESATKISPLELTETPRGLLKTAATVETKPKQTKQKNDFQSQIAIQTMLQELQEILNNTKVT